MRVINTSLLDDVLEAFLEAGEAIPFDGILVVNACLELAHTLIIFLVDISDLLTLKVDHAISSRAIVMVVIFDAFDVEAQILVARWHFARIITVIYFTMTRVRHHAAVIAGHATRLVQPRQEVGRVVPGLATKDHVLARLDDDWLVHVT